MWKPNPPEKKKRALLQAPSVLLITNSASYIMLQLMTIQNMKCTMGWARTMLDPIRPKISTWLSSGQVCGNCGPCRTVQLYIIGHVQPYCTNVGRKEKRNFFELWTSAEYACLSKTVFVWLKNTIHKVSLAPWDIHLLLGIEAYNELSSPTLTTNHEVHGLTIYYLNKKFTDFSENIYNFQKVYLNWDFEGKNFHAEIGSVLCPSIKYQAQPLRFNTRPSAIH